MAKKDLVSADPAAGVNTTAIVEIDVPVPMPEPEGGWPADEFTGHGGSFVRDPVTGVRSRAAPVAD